MAGHRATVFVSKEHFFGRRKQNQSRLYMNKSENKIGLITGGSRGLGRNTVLSLARRGVSSIFTYNTNQEEAEKVVNLVAETGQNSIALRLDTGNSSAFDPFVLGDLASKM
jgi:NAD(P)-dependent dehydrogenase (short-subunit alcohol dehydrogenase family)